MIPYRLLLLLLSISMLVVSCNTENGAADESELAYQDYKNFVAQVEKDTVVTEIDLGNTWEMDTDTLQMLYDKYQKSANEKMDNYDPERQEEVKAFAGRLAIATKKRQEKYNEVSHRYELRKKIMGMEVSEDDMSQITAANLVSTYQHFISTLQSNLKDYEMRDWQLIEGWWNALNNRRQAVSSELQPSDLETISELEKMYRQLKADALPEPVEVGN